MSKLGIIRFRVMAVFLLQDIGGHNFQGELLHSSHPKHPVVFGKPNPLAKQNMHGVGDHIAKGLQNTTW